MVTLASGAPPPAVDVEPSRTLARVLLVDDDPDVRRLLGRALVDDHELILARDGREALDLAAQRPPDLVITDLVMPRMTGDELVRALRQRDDMADVPILVLTALADEALRVRLLAGEVQDFLLKPVSLDELQARVRNLIDMKRARDVLRAELARRSGDLADLAHELALRKRELDLALEEMRVAREAAEAASAAKDRLLNLVSHELRSPLQALRLQVHRLMREGLTDRQDALVRALDRSSVRLSELVQSLLDHVAASRCEAQLTDVEVAGLLTSVLDELRPRAAEKGLELALTADAPLVARTDPRLLRLIARHLVANAIKFTGRGRVDVSARRDADALVVAVADTGVGLTPEQQARMFDPFAHGEDPLHKHTPGLGLGLSLVRQLTETLGGAVTVASSQGVGSTFTVRLPQPGPSEP